MAPTVLTAVSRSVSTSRATPLRGCILPRSGVAAHLQCRESARRGRDRRLRRRSQRVDQASTYAGMASSVYNEGGTARTGWMGRRPASTGRAPQISHTPLRTLPALRHEGQSATSTATRRRPRAAALWSIVTSCDDSQGCWQRRRGPPGPVFPEVAPLLPSGQATATSGARSTAGVYCNRRTVKGRITMLQRPVRVG